MSAISGRHRRVWLEPGADLGAFRIQERIASGGMGRVYRAVHRALGVVVAIKALRVGSDPDDAQRLARFKREALLGMRLRHPNIVAVYHYDEEPPLHYMSMEYCPGETLKERLARAERLPPDEAVLIGHALARTLIYAHDSGVIHRDLKPENVLLLRRGRGIKLIDFGIGKALGESTVTQPGVIIGTPDYLPPDQIEDAGGVSAAADAFALGMLCFELLSGELPFPRPENQDHLQDLSRFDERRELPSDVPPPLRSLVDGLLRRHPEDRSPLREVVQRFAELEERLRETRVPPPAEQGRALWLGAERVPLGRRGKLLLGRGVTCDVKLRLASAKDTFDRIAGRHCELLLDDPVRVRRLSDLPLLLNGEEVPAEAEVEVYDQAKLGVPGRRDLVELDLPDRPRPQPE